MFCRRRAGGNGRMAGRILSRMRARLCPFAVILTCSGFPWKGECLWDFLALWAVGSASAGRVTSLHRQDGSVWSDWQAEWKPHLAEAVPMGGPESSGAGTWVQHQGKARSQSGALGVDRAAQGGLGSWRLELIWEQGWGGAPGSTGQWQQLQGRAGFSPPEFKAWCRF